MLGIPVGTGGSSALAVALQAAYLAGPLLRERFLGPKEVTEKSRGNLVTDVDLLVEQQVLALLRAEFPAFRILSEESPAVESDSDYIWIVDPLDGTRNYASGVPHFAFNIALAKAEDVLLGLTYDPVREELFLAIKGRGATLNGRPLSVSRHTDILQCLLGFDMGYSDERARKALQLIQGLWPGMQSIRVLGSAALGLAYAAAGRLDLYFHHNIYPWDITPGLLLVREAGGQVVDRQGRPARVQTDGVIASSHLLLERFLQVTEGSPWRQM